MNLYDALKESSLRFSSKTALTQGDRHVSYAELEASVKHFAASLCTAGIHKGDRVAMLLGNSIEFVIAYLGIIKSGAVAVLLDPKYKPAELVSLLEDCRPKALVSEKSCLDLLSNVIHKFKEIELVVSVSHDVCKPSISFIEFLNSGSHNLDIANISDDDIAHIAYTSGPSFAPKGVVVPHGNLVKEIRISAASFNQTENDVIIQFALPLHHVIGLVSVMLTSLYCGSSVIILNGVSIDSLMSSIERHKVTMFIGVPFIHAMLLRKVKEEGTKYSLNSIRFCGSAGDILPAITVESYDRLLNLRLINFYGLTETMGHVTCEPLKGAYEKGSVGQALPGWEIQIADATGCSLPANAAGEVIIRGPIMTEYYGKPEATNKVRHNGWLHTGDLGKLDEKGYLYILGIQKDMLICKGQNIFPSDIEHVLSQYPGVKQVAAVGVPDEIRGEVVGAMIVMQNNAHVNETNIQRFCLERLANYKVPKYFAFCEAIPLNNNGKAEKSAIKEYFITRLKAQ